ERPQPAQRVRIPAGAATEPVDEPAQLGPAALTLLDKPVQAQWRSTVCRVRLDDRITISTPEGVDMEITLAGLGSRAIAGLLDLTIEVFLLIGLFLAYRLVGGHNGVTAAIFIVVIFLVL